MALCSLAALITTGLFGLPVVAFNLAQGERLITTLPLVATLVVAATVAFALLGPPEQGRAWAVFIASALVWPSLYLTGGWAIATAVVALALPVAAVSSLMAILRARREARDS